MLQKTKNIKIKKKVFFVYSTDMMTRINLDEITSPRSVMNTLSYKPFTRKIPSTFDTWCNIEVFYQLLNFSQDFHMFGQSD